jgi:hypothetical protein
MKHFHTTFLNILDNKDPIKEIDENDIIISDSLLNTSDDIINNAGYFIKGIKRPQELLNTNINYYIARDSLTNTVYICFKNLLMIDIDLHKINNTEITDEYIINYFSKKKESFRIFKSINGYHVFCTSKKFKYRSKESLEFMLNNMCDKYYCMYSYLRGYCVRLNKKFNEEYQCLEKNTKIYKLLAIINKNNELPEQKKKLQLIDMLLHKYNNEYNLNIIKK